MRVAVDTNVLISAVGWNGNERQVIEKALDGEVILIIGDKVIDEFDEVVQRQKFSFIDRSKIDSFLQLLSHFAEIVHPKENVCLIAEDPDDDMVLESAIEGSVDVIVTGDKHLLRLGKFNGIPIVTASQFLDLLSECRGQ